MNTVPLEVSGKRPSSPRVVSSSTLVSTTPVAWSRAPQAVWVFFQQVLKARPRSSGASKQEEASQNFAQAFVWPPPHFAERRRRLLMQKNLLPAIPGEGYFYQQPSQAADKSVPIVSQASSTSSHTVENGLSGACQWCLKTGVDP